MGKIVRKDDCRNLYTCCITGYKKRDILPQKSNANSEDESGNL